MTWIGNDGDGYGGGCYFDHGDDDILAPAVLKVRNESAESVKVVELL